MKTNGETRRALEKCSCSIDVIASILLLRSLCRRGDRSGTQKRKALQFKENIALVLKYFDQLVPIMQEQIRSCNLRIRNDIYANPAR